MNITTTNGKIKSMDTLFDEALEEMMESIEDNLSDAQQLYVGNMYREDNGYTELRELNEYNINDALDGMKPWDIVNQDIDTYCSYFYYDGYDVTCTDDVWEDITVEDIARAILNDDLRYRDLPRELQDIYDEYEEARDKLENMNEGRKMAYEIVQKYVNCDADVSDLLVVLGKLAKNEDYWSEE